MKSRVHVITVLVLVLISAASCSRRMPQVQAQSQQETPDASSRLVKPAVTFIDEKKEYKEEVIWETPVPQPDEFLDYVPLTRQPQEMTLTCSKNNSTVVIDGVADEAAWSDAQPITTLDFSSQRPIELRSFHDGRNIYVLAKYPDQAASETHKSWFWDSNEKVYKPGLDREDMFVLKWLMTGDSLYLAADKVSPHTSDVWFWKAARTNPGGYVDDKIDSILAEDGKDAAKLKSDKYGTLYLYRPGDKGDCAYAEDMVFEYCGQCIAGFTSVTPSGSRADIGGKGVWKDGFWTIEMSRKLNTGNDDDIAFASGGKYRFAATLYEMAGSGANKEWWQPLYRTGDAFDQLILDVE